MRTSTSPLARFLPLIALIALVPLLSGCQRSRPIDVVMSDGVEAFEQGEYDVAQADFDEFVGRRPGEARGRYMLGRTLLELDQTIEAREQLYLAHTLDLEDDEIFEWLAEALFRDGSVDELYSLLRQRCLDSGRPSHYRLLASYAMRLGDPDEAERALLTMARLDEGRSVGPQLALADFYEDVGDEAKAVRRLRMAYYLDQANEAIADRLRSHGEIPGPTIGIPPEERASAGADQGM